MRRELTGRMGRLARFPKDASASDTTFCDGLRFGQKPVPFGRSVVAGDEGVRDLLLGVAFEGALEDDFKGGFDLGVFGGRDGAVNLFAFESEELFLECVEQIGVLESG